MSFSISVKDYNIGAGDTLRLQIPGTFFQLMAAEADVDVRLTRAHSVFGDAVAVPLGFSIGPLNDSEAFDGVEIYSASAQAVKVCIARGAVDLRSITQVSGTVSVVNGELSKVMSSLAFSGVADMNAAQGSYAHAQLWNPPASGVNVVVSRINSFSGSGATPIRIGKSSVAAATKIANGLNKLFSGPASKAELRVESAATFSVLDSDRIQNVGLGSMYSIVDVPLAEPVVIVPGTGVVVTSTIVNFHVNASFQWSEVAR